MQQKIIVFIVSRKTYRQWLNVPIHIYNIYADLDNIYLSGKLSRPT